MFVIPKDTKCHIHRKGTGDGWEEYRTTKELTFGGHGVTDNGGRWVFETANGWLLKVPSCFVQGRDPTAGRKEFVPLKRGKASTGRGKGASRRRSRRRGR